MSGPAPPGVTPIRHLGRFRLVAVGINSVIGGGIFIMPAEVARLVGPAAIALAEAEGLQAHARSIALRLPPAP